VNQNRATQVGLDSAPPLHGTRVVDLSSGIGGAYCTKLLADGGADIVKVESTGGDPLRRWVASGASIPPGADGALFNFVSASKRSVALGDGGASDSASVHKLLGTADIAVWSPNPGGAGVATLSPVELVDRHPHLVVTSITPFGLDGPWSDRAATEFTLQAWSGAIIGLARGRSDRAPVYVGGQIGEWLSGVFGAIGTLAARRRTGEIGELVDISMLEVLATCLTYYPVTFNDQLGHPMRRRRLVPTPGVGQARDGLVGLGVGTGQQWLDFCAMVEHPEWIEDSSLFLDRSKLAPTIDAWLAARDVDEVLDLASALRIPNAPIADGSNIATFSHFVERGTFVKNPKDGATNPVPAFRLGSARLRAPEPAPALGEHSFDDVLAGAVGKERHGVVEGTALPFSGLRVVELTSYWAGPLVGHLLALLGADVIHVESTTRPDGARLVGGVPQTEERYWEKGPIFAALNTNKRSVTLDLQTARGRDLFRQLVATCDAVVENNTPRVLDQLGLDYPALREVRPDLVMLRMPGFGLDGPWRDRSAFAFVIEDASGLTWLTGHPDLLPYEPYCVGDSNAGLHALFGLLLALEHRQRTGQGGLVEAAMVDAAVNVTSEQVIEHTAYGATLTRSGNRGPCAAPQNLYRVAGTDEYGRDDCWVAIAVADDDQWCALRHALGDPEWAADPALATAAGRASEHEQIDGHLEEWCHSRSADEVVDQLWGEGVPVGKVLFPHRQPDLPQLEHRGFFEELEHPVIGSSRYSTLPIGFSRGPQRWHRRHAPMLGEDNDDLLGELGLTDTQIAALVADGVIGDRLVDHA